jgi:hypothetical protein
MLRAVVVGDHQVAADHEDVFGEWIVFQVSFAFVSFPNTHAGNHLTGMVITESDFLPHINAGLDRQLLRRCGTVHECDRGRFGFDG